MANDDFDDRGGGGGGIPAFVMPMVTAMLALLLGAGVGALGAWVIKPAQIEVKEVPRDLSEAELNAVCAPKVAAVAADLDKANNKVNDLVAQVKEKEGRVIELETEMKRRGKAGAELKRQLDEARAELEEVKAQLAQAIQEKEEVVRELKKTLRDLDDQKQETRAAKEESLDNRWQAFVNASQLEVCERGNRKKLGKCRDAVVSYMNADMQARYEHCMRSGQEEPKIKEIQKGEELPQFAQYLDQENKIVRDWYVQLCDPSLPEAEDFAELNRPSTSPAVEGSAAGAGTPSEGGSGSGELSADEIDIDE